MRIFLVLGTIFGVILGVVPLAQAFTVAVSPARIETELTSRPQTQTIKIVNYGNSPTSLKIRVANFDLDAANKVREIRPEPNSLDQWIIIRPLALTLAPGEARTIRFAIRPLSRPRTGEHRAMIFLEQDRANSNSVGAIDVSYRLGVAVYAHLGAKRLATKVHNVAASPQGITVNLESKGDAQSRLSGAYAVWPAGKSPANAVAAVKQLTGGRDGRLVVPKGAVASGMLAGLPVFPGTRRAISTPWASGLPKGDYTVVVAGQAGEQSLARTLPLKIRGL